MRKTVIGAIAILIAAALWGVDGVFLTPRLFNLNVVFVVFMLHAIPFLIMSVFLYKEYAYLRTFTPKDYLTFLLIAITGGALGTYAIVKALFLVNFQALSVVILLQKLQPVFAIALATILLKEKLRKNYALWAGIAIVSSYVLAFGFSLPQMKGNVFASAVWALVAAACFGAATVFGKMALKKYAYHTTNFYRFGFTAVLMLAVVLFSGLFSELANVTSTNWLFFIIIAFTTGSGAIFIYYYGLKHVTAMVSTICELMFPITAVMLDYVINGHFLAWVQWLAAALMLFAIYKITSDPQMDKG
ncbi:MAG: EamA family transporter [archaeon]